MAKYNEIMDKVRQKRFEQDVAKVDDEYLRRFSESAGSYLDSAKSQYDGLGYGNAYQSYLNRRDSYNDLDYRRRVIQEWNKRNPGKLDQQSASWLDSFGKDSKSILESFYNAKDFFSLFESEDAYNGWRRKEDFINQYLADPEKAMSAMDYEDGWLRDAQYRLDSQVLDAKDFPGYSKYVSTAKNRKIGAPDFGDNLYEYINNQTFSYNLLLDGEVSGSARDIIESRRRAYNADSPTRNSDSVYERNHYELMKKEEVAIYNYYYAKEGKKRAEAFLDTLSGTLEGAMVENVSRIAKEHPFLASAASVGTSLGSGFEYAGDVLRFGRDKLIGKDARMGTNELGLMTNAVRGTVSDMVDWEIGNWDAFDFVYSTVMSGADSMTSGMLGGAGGLVLGLSAAAQGTNDALQRGMSSDKAFWNGLFSGVFEGLFESVSLGNFNKLKEVAPDRVKTIFKNIGKSMLVNASEETLTEIANIGYDTLMNGEFANYTWEDLKNGAWKNALVQVLESGASGALMGAGFGVTGNIIGYASGSMAAKQLYGADPGALVRESLEIDPENRFAQRMQRRVSEGKKLSGGQLMRLAMQNESAITAKDMRAIREAASARLSELGETGDINALAAVIAKQAAGDKLTRSEKAAIAGSIYGQRVADELNPDNILETGNAEAWVKGLNTERIHSDVYTSAGNATAEKTEAVGEEFATTDEDSTEVPSLSLEEAAKGYGDQAQAMIHTYQAGQDVAKYEAAYRNAFEMGRSGVNFDYVKGSKGASYLTEEQKELAYKAGVDAGKSGSDTASVQKIVAMENGDVTVAMEDGSQIQLEKAEMSPAEKTQIQAITNIEGITAQDADKILGIVRENAGKSAHLGIVDAKEAYRYGYYGYSQAKLDQQSDHGGGLTKSQRQAVYEIGRAARNATVQKRTQLLAESAVVAKNATTDQKATGKVHFDGDRAALTERQSTSLTAMEKIADVTGLQVHVFESKAATNGKRIGANGWYDPNDSSIHIDLHAGANGEGTMLFTLAHELTHHIRQWSPEKFKVLADFLMNEYGKADVDVDGLVSEQIRKAERNGRTISYDVAFEEVVADSMETMLSDGNVMKRLEKLKAQDKSLWQKIKRFIDDLAAKIREIYKGLSPDSVEGRYVADMGKAVYKLQELFAEALVDASENYQASLTPGEEGVVTNRSGDPVAYATEDGSVLLSMRTYEEEGREAFRNYLQKCVSSKKLTKAEMQEMLDGIEEIYGVCKEFKDKYAPFSSWSDAAVVQDTHGRPVFSVVTPNGDYKMNLDFSLVCKKRRTLDAVFNEMSRRGIIDDFELGQKSVVKINEIIRKYGLETACALCFVDAKRFRQASMADQFTRLYNELVESLVPEDQKGSIDHFNFSGYETIKRVEGGINTWDNSRLDFAHLNHVMQTYGKGTVEYKAARYIKTHPEGRKLLLRGDFMSSQGFDAVKTQNQDILKLYNSKKGTGGPKAAFGDVQYMNEVISKNKSWTPEKAYAVGGVRIQSFSDYVPRMVFDYVQMIYDLAATKLPAHAYTKEALFVKQFGLTGVKINMSLIPAIAEGGIAPGLDANGDYVWAGESFDFETAKQIQNAPGYTENCGTICVGVSDRHIRKLLSDPDIRMVIPYHKSGLNPIVAHMNKIAEFTDYTLKQNTTVKGTTTKAEKHFDFNAALHKMGKNADPRAVIQQYFDWCDDNGYEPKFAEFRDHPNYYKLIEDFTLFDKDGNYVPQREVRAVFPKADSAFGSMKDLIKEGLEEDAVVEGKRDKNLSKIVDEIQKTLPKTEAEIAEEQVTQADRDLEAVIRGIEADVHTEDAVAIAEQVTDAMNTIKLSDRDHAHRDETYSSIGKELLAYEEGDMKPDLTLVEMVNERTGKTETTIKHFGQKPKDYIPKRIAYCYKLFEQHPDGSLHALFAGARSATPIGEWQYAKGFPYTDEGVKGMNLRERYGWHLSAGLPSAPHLMSTKDFARGYPSKGQYGHPKGSKRVWVRMAYDASTDFNAIADSTKAGDIFGLIPFGGYYAFKENNQSEWVISSAVKIDKILTEDERQQILRDAGYDEYEAWRKKHRATDEEKAANKRKSAENKKAKDKAIKAGLNYLSESSRTMRESIQSRIIDNPEIKYSDRDTDGNQLTEDQVEFFENSKARDENGNLYVMYHGSRSPLFTEFDMYEGVWLTPDQRYAEVYAEMWHSWRDEDQDLTGLEQSVYADPDYRLYKMYANITNPLDLGEINDEFDRKQMNRLARLLGVPTSRIRNISHHDGYQTVGYVYEVTKDHQFIEIAKEKGYDGFVASERGRKTFCAFNAPNQVKLTTNEVPSGFYDIRYSDRDTESVSNRSLLANAFEGVAQNDIERKRLADYKAKIDKINAEEGKLQELNRQIREMTFGKGEKNADMLKTLRAEAQKTANRIDTYDRQLLRLEASKPLQNLINREKKHAYAQARQRGEDAQKAYRERSDRTAMRHKIQKVVKELNDLLLNESKKRHVPDSLKKAVAEALSLVNMDTVGAAERIAKYEALIAQETDQDKIDAYTVTLENIKRQGEKTAQRLKELRDAYDEIQESSDPDIANAYDPVIAGSLKELSQSIGDTSLLDMTMEQLSDVYDMYRMVLTRVRDANKAFINGKKESIRDLASRVVGEVKRTGGEHTYRVAALDPVRSFLWNNLKPVYAFEHLGSSTLTEVFKGVRKGEDTWAQDVTEARAYYLDKSKKYGYDKWDFKKKHRFESNSGIPFELTLEQMLSLYAYSKRDQAHDHLRLGGFVFDSSIESYKDKGSKLVKYRVNTADAHQISPEILADIISHLSKDQIGFVDEMQDYLSSTMGAKGNEVTMEMYGVKLFKEKHYFPLKSARQFLFEQNEVSGEVKIKNSGFTNKTVAKANNPIILNNFMDVWSGHVNDMSMYHAFVLPLEDFNRVFNYNSPKSEGQASVSVKGTIQSAYSPAAVHYVKNLITDLNGGARTDSTTGFINKMMGLFKKGAVFASLSVVVQQPSAVARAAALMDTKYFIGPKVDAKRHKALWEEVKQYAPVCIIKEMGYFDTNMGKSTKDFIEGKEYSGFWDKMKALVTDSGYRDEVLSKAPALADEIAWCAIWEAVKRETKAQNHGMDTRSEEFLRKAGERFTEVITKTQVYDSVLSRSANMRSKDTGMKMATAFMAEPTTSINMIADAMLQGKRGNRKYTRKAVGAVIASQILNSILVSFVYAGRDDDEDETYLEKYLGTLSGQIVDSLNPAGYIPFIKDIQSIVQGYDVERSDMAVISDLWNAWKKLGNDNLSVYRKVEGFAGSIAQLFGLPVKNIMRDVRGIYQTIESFMNDQITTKAGIGYAVKERMPKIFGGGTTSNQQQLYEAYLDGDPVQIARVEGRYKDQSAIDSAIRKALREHDTRVWEAAIAWNENDLERYMELAREIIGEGHFSQDNVVLAIRAEADAMVPDEESASNPKAKGYFNVEKFAVAAIEGKTSLAGTIRADILATSQKNGATLAEAESSFRSALKTELKDLFISGEITRQKATEVLLQYHNMTDEGIDAEITKWQCQKETGIPYADIDDAFRNGEITLAKAQQMYMKYGGLSREDAEDKVAVLEFSKKNPTMSDITANAITKYKEHCEGAGVSPRTFYEAWKHKDGLTGTGDVKEPMLEYINGLNLTVEQKDALYFAFGWAASKLGQTPWH